MNPAGNLTTDLSAMNLLFGLRQTIVFVVLHLQYGDNGSVTELVSMTKIMFLNSQELELHGLNDKRYNLHLARIFLSSDTVCTMEQIN